MSKASCTCPSRAYRSCWRTMRTSSSSREISLCRVRDQPEVEGADERDIIVTGKRPGIVLFYENVYRNIHKELIEVASKQEKRHKILLEQYEMVKPSSGRKGGTIRPSWTSPARW